MIEIRVATLDDADSIAALTQALSRRRIRADCTPSGFETLLETMAASCVRERMAGGYRHWVAESGEVLAGVCVLREPAHVYHLFVAEAFQRQSVARRLLETAIAHCRRAEPRLTEITLNASSFGLPAYERLGFVKTGERLERAGITSQPMRKPLAPSTPP